MLEIGKNNTSSKVGESSPSLSPGGCFRPGEYLFLRRFVFLCRGIIGERRGQGATAAEVRSVDSRGAEMGWRCNGTAGLARWKRRQTS